MENCAPPTEFRTFSDDGLDVSIVTLSKSEVESVRVIYLNVEPFYSEELGVHYRLNIFSHKSSRSLLITYLSNKKFGLRDEYAADGVAIKEEILVIQDHRTPPRRLKAEEGSEEREASGEPPPKFDNLEIEYEYTEEYTSTPDWVFSMGSDGRLHRKRIYGPFDSGFFPGDGHTMIGVRINATPYKVMPGKKVYRIKLVMHDGKERYMRIEVLTDIEPDI